MPAPEPPAAPNRPSDGPWPGPDPPGPEPPADIGSARDGGFASLRLLCLTGLFFFFMAGHHSFAQISVFSSGFGPYRALFAWGQPDCFFAPRLPFLDFLLFLDFFAFLIFLLFAAFFAFGCAAGAATVT